jgi:hypothetical protein
MPGDGSNNPSHVSKRLHKLAIVAACGCLVALFCLYCVLTGGVVLPNRARQRPLEISDAPRHAIAPSFLPEVGDDWGHLPLPITELEKYYPQLSGFQSNKLPENLHLAHWPLPSVQLRSLSESQDNGLFDGVQWELSHPKDR